METKSLKSFLKVAALAALLVASGSAFAETRVAAVNVSKLMESAPQAQSASNTIKERFGSREKELVSERDSLKKLEEQYNKDKDILSASEKESTENDLRSRMREFKRKSDTFNEDFTMARNEALSALQTQVYKAITEVAKAESYDIVLSESVLYASEKVDITDAVLGKLKQMGN